MSSKCKETREIKNAVPIKYTTTNYSSKLHRCANLDGALGRYDGKLGCAFVKDDFDIKNAYKLCEASNDCKGITYYKTSSEGPYVCFHKSVGIKNATATCHVKGSGNKKWTINKNKSCGDGGDYDACTINNNTKKVEYRIKIPGDYKNKGENTKNHLCYNSSCQKLFGKTHGLKKGVYYVSATKSEKFKDMKDYNGGLPIKLRLRPANEYTNNYGNSIREKWKDDNLFPKTSTGRKIKTDRGDISIPGWNSKTKTQNKGISVEVRLRPPSEYDVSYVGGFKGLAPYIPCPLTVFQEIKTAYPRTYKCDPVKIGVWACGAKMEGCFRYGYRTAETGWKWTGGYGVDTNAYHWKLGSGGANGPKAQPRLQGDVFVGDSKTKKIAKDSNGLKITARLNSRGFPRTTNGEGFLEFKLNTSISSKFWKDDKSSLDGDYLKDFRPVHPDGFGALEAKSVCNSLGFNEGVALASYKKRYLEEDKSLPAGGLIYFFGGKTKRASLKSGRGPAQIDCSHTSENFRKVGKYQSNQKVHQKLEYCVITNSARTGGGYPAVGISSAWGGSTSGEAVWLKCGAPRRTTGPAATGRTNGMPHHKSGTNGAGHIEIRLGENARKILGSKKLKALTPTAPNDTWMPVCNDKFDNVQSKRVSDSFCKTLGYSAGSKCTRSTQQQAGVNIGTCSAKSTGSGYNYKYQYPSVYANKILCDNGNGLENCKLNQDIPSTTSCGAHEMVWLECVGSKNDTRVVRNVPNSTNEGHVEMKIETPIHKKGSSSNQGGKWLPLCYTGKENAEKTEYKYSKDKTTSLDNKTIMNKTTTDSLCRSVGFPEGADHTFKGGSSKVDGTTKEITGYTASNKYSYGEKTEKMMDAPYCPEMDAPKDISGLLGNKGPTSGTGSELSDEKGTQVQLTLKQCHDRCYKNPDCKYYRYWNTSKCSIFRDAKNLDSVRNNSKVYKRDCKIKNCFQRNMEYENEEGSTNLKTIPKDELMALGGEVWNKKDGYSCWKVSLNVCSGNNCDSSKLGWIPSRHTSGKQHDGIHCPHFAAGDNTTAKKNITIEKAKAYCSKLGSKCKGISVYPNVARPSICFREDMDTNNGKTSAAACYVKGNPVLNTTASICQQLCKEHDRCTNFTIDSSRNCKLYDQPTMLKYNKSSNVVSGPRGCRGNCYPTLEDCKINTRHPYPILKGSCDKDGTVFLKCKGTKVSPKKESDLIKKSTTDKEGYVQVKTGSGEWGYLNVEDCYDKTGKIQYRGDHNTWKNGSDSGKCLSWNLKGFSGAHRSADGGWSTPDRIKHDGDNHNKCRDFGTGSQRPWCYADKWAAGSQAGRAGGKGTQYCDINNCDKSNNAAKKICKGMGYTDGKVTEVTNNNKDCFTYNIDYNTRSSSHLGSATTTNSPQKCQERCHLTDGCNYFSWWPNGGCHIFKDNKNKNVSNNTISGPKYCSNNIIKCNSSSNGELNDCTIEEEDCYDPDKPYLGYHNTWSGIGKWKQMYGERHSALGEKGGTCLPWDTSPWRGDNSDSKINPYSIAIRNKYGLKGNYCRNPFGMRPWCYTTDKKIKWAYCNIPKCRKKSLWIKCSGTNTKYDTSKSNALKCKALNDKGKCDILCRGGYRPTGKNITCTNGKLDSEKNRYSKGGNFCIPNKSCEVSIDTFPPRVLIDSNCLKMARQGYMDHNKVCSFTCRDKLSGDNSKYSVKCVNKELTMNSKKYDIKDIKCKRKDCIFDKNDANTIMVNSDPNDGSLNSCLREEEIDDGKFCTHKCRKGLIVKRDSSNIPVNKSKNNLLPEGRGFIKGFASNYDCLADVDGISGLKLNVKGCGWPSEIYKDAHIKAFSGFLDKCLVKKNDDTVSLENCTYTKVESGKKGVSIIPKYNIIGGKIKIKDTTLKNLITQEQSRNKKQSEIQDTWNKNSDPINNIKKNEQKFTIENGTIKQGGKCLTVTNSTVKFENCARASDAKKILQQQHFSAEWPYIRHKAKCLTLKKNVITVDSCIPCPGGASSCSNAVSTQWFKPNGNEGGIQLRINLGAGSTRDSTGKLQNKISNDGNGKKKKIEGHLEMKMEGDTSFRPVCSKNIWIRSRNAICRDMGYSKAFYSGNKKGDTESITNKQKTYKRDGKVVKDFIGGGAPHCSIPADNPTLEQCFIGDSGGKGEPQLKGKNVCSQNTETLWMECINDDANTLDNMDTNTKIKCDNGIIKNTGKCIPKICKPLQITKAPQGGFQKGQCGSSNMEHDSVCTTITCNKDFGINGTAVLKKKYKCDTSTTTATTDGDIWRECADDRCSNITSKYLKIESDNKVTEYTGSTKGATHNTGEYIKCRRSKCFKSGGGGSPQIYDTVDFDNAFPYKSGHSACKRLYDNGKKKTECDGYGDCYFKCKDGYSPYVDNKLYTNKVTVKIQGKDKTYNNSAKITCGDSNKFGAASCVKDPCDLTQSKNKTIKNSFFKGCDNGAKKQKASTNPTGDEKKFLSVGQSCNIQCKTGYRLKDPRNASYKCIAEKVIEKNIPLKQIDRPWGYFRETPYTYKVVGKDLKLKLPGGRSFGGGQNKFSAVRNRDGGLDIEMRLRPQNTYHPKDPAKPKDQYEGHVEMRFTPRDINGTKFYTYWGASKGRPRQGGSYPPGAGPKKEIKEFLPLCDDTLCQKKGFCKTTSYRTTIQKSLDAFCKELGSPGAEPLGGEESDHPHQRFVSKTYKQYNTTKDMPAGWWFGNWPKNKHNNGPEDNWAQGRIADGGNYGYPTEIGCGAGEAVYVRCKKPADPKRRILTNIMVKQGAAEAECEETVCPKPSSMKGYAGSLPSTLKMKDGKKAIQCDSENIRNVASSAPTISCTNKGKFSQNKDKSWSWKNTDYIASGCKPGSCNIKDPPNTVKSKGSGSPSSPPPPSSSSISNDITYTCSPGYQGNITVNSCLHTTTDKKEKCTEDTKFWGAFKQNKCFSITKDGSSNCKGDVYFSKSGGGRGRGAKLWNPFYKKCFVNTGLGKSDCSGGLHWLSGNMITGKVNSKSQSIISLQCLKDGNSKTKIQQNEKCELSTCDISKKLPANSVNDTCPPYNRLYHNGECKYKCANGYVLSDDKKDGKLKCNKGNVSIENSCKESPCDISKLSIGNGAKNSCNKTNSLKHNETCTMKCNSGYKLDGGFGTSKLVKCDKGGIIKPSCIPVSCSKIEPKINNINLGECTFNNAKYGICFDKDKKTCNTSWDKSAKFVDNKCYVSVTIGNKCNNLKKLVTEKQCKSLSGSKWTKGCSFNKLGADCSSVCDAGYSILDNNKNTGSNKLTTICKGERENKSRWSSSHTNGKDVWINDGNPTTTNTICKRTNCFKGSTEIQYTIPVTDTTAKNLQSKEPIMKVMMKCSKGGKYITKSECDKLKGIWGQGSTQKCSGIGKCYYQCKSGYSPGGDVSKKYGIIECGGINKTFTSGSCLPNECNLSSNDNKKVKNGFFKGCSNGTKNKASTNPDKNETNMLSTNKTCDIQCKTGYRLSIPSMKTYKCQISKGKNLMVKTGAQEAFCEKIKCDIPSDNKKYLGYVPKSGKFPTNIDLLNGKMLLAKCSNNFIRTKINDEPFLTCNRNGTYNASTKKWVNSEYTFSGCQEGKCKLPNKSNASKSQSEIKIGDTFNYTCNKGYRSVAQQGKTIDVNKIKVDCKKINGVAKLQDNPNEKVKCGITKCNLSQDKVSKSKFGGSGCSGASVNYSQKCDVVCNIGTKLADDKNKQYECKEVSGAIKMAPTVKPATCSDLTCDVSKKKNLTNGTGGDCKTSLTHKKTCSPTCNKGYTVSGQMICDFSKNSSLTVPRCIQNSCNPGSFIRPVIQLQEYKNNVLQDISGKSVDCNNKKHNDKCEVTCPTSYTIENGGGVNKVEYTCDSGNKAKIIWKSNISGQNIEVTKDTKATTKKFTCRFASCFTNKNIDNTVDIPNITYTYKDSKNKNQTGNYRQGDRILRRTLKGKVTTCIGQGKCYFKCATGYFPMIDGKPLKSVINNDKQIGIVECSTKNSTRNAVCAPLPCDVKKPDPKYPIGAITCQSGDVDKSGILKHSKTCTLKCDENLYKGTQKTYKCNLGKLQQPTSGALSCKKLTCPDPVIPNIGTMDIIKKVLDKSQYDITLQCKEGSQFKDKDTWKIPVPTSKGCKYICPGQKISSKNCKDIKDCSVVKPCLQNDGKKCVAMTSESICPNNTTLCNDINIGCKITPPKCITCPKDKLNVGDSKYCGLPYWNNRESKNYRIVPPYIYISSPNTKDTKNLMKSNVNTKDIGTKWDSLNIYDGIYAKKKGTGIEDKISKKWIPPAYTRIAHFYEELCGLSKKMQNTATLTFNHLGKGFHGPRDHGGRWELKVKANTFKKQWIGNDPKNKSDYKNKEWTIIRYPVGKLSDISPLMNDEMKNADLLNNLTKPKKHIMDTRINSDNQFNKNHIDEKAIRNSEYHVDIIMVAINDEKIFEKIKDYKDCYGTPKKKLFIL